jgi:hypothetical protein
MVGVGRGFITTLTVAVLVHVFTVAITVYTPACITCMFAIVGFCRLLENPFGPVQE